MDESKLSDPVASLPEGRDGTSKAAFRLPVWCWLMAWMGFWVGGSMLAHYLAHGVVNGWQVTVAIFLAINMLIAIWEISLYFRIGDLERWHREPRATSGKPRGNLYTTKVTVSELASTHLWARVWSEYARYDPSYAERRSFGFAIDVGNGFSTLLPSLFLLIGLTFPLVSPVVLGVVGILVFYQKFYCTCLYFFTYIFNRRYEGHSAAAVIGVVGGTNGIWLVFPAVGFYVCLRLLFENRFDLIWT
jgi:hypothetical protein